MPRAYDADLSALCDNKKCPLWKKNCAPVHSIESDNALAVIVCEHPGPQEQFWRQPLRGYAGRRAHQALRSVGLNRVSVCNRIGCFPPQHMATDSIKASAAKHCAARFTRIMQRLTPANDLPILLLGKHAGDGWAPRVSRTLRSGATKTLPVMKLARGMVADNICYLDNPALAFWHKAPLQVLWLAGLERFAKYLRNETESPPPIPIIDIGEEALTALRSMGHTIGWDVETLGIDPTSSPITCIGISDGERTVSMPWDTYSVAGTEVVGLASATVGTAKQIRDEILRVLASDRIHATQNGSYDVLAMGAKGLPGRNDYDTMHAHKICWPEIPAGLEEVAVHLVPRLSDRWKTIFRGGRDETEGVAKGWDAFADSAPADLRDYNGMDAWATVAAVAPLNDELSTED